MSYRLTKEKDIQILIWREIDVMKVSKKTIVIMMIICILVLCISIIFEFTNYDTEIAKGMHIEYYKNLCLGMFASGLLVLIPAIVQYNTEKSNYYIEMYRYLDGLYIMLWISYLLWKSTIITLIYQRCLVILVLHIIK